MNRLLGIFLVCALALLCAPALAGAQTAHGRSNATHHKQSSHKKKHRRAHKRHHTRKTLVKHDAVRYAAHAHGTDTGVCANTTLTPAPGDLEAVRAATLCLVNRERVTRGERALKLNGKLQGSAQGHSENMAAEDYFAHEGPEGSTPLSRMRAAGYIYSSRIGYEVGENIAWGTLWLATPKAIVEAWMNSPGHRANILDHNYRDTGIGVSPHPLASQAQGQPGAIYTQDFGVIITG